MRFEGIIPPVITPFHDDGSIDKDGYATVIDTMIEGGVQAVIAGGTPVSVPNPAWSQSLPAARRGNSMP